MADHIVKDIAALEALYGQPGKASLIKVADHLTPLYAKWIMASRLCIVSTIGPDGTDGSPVVTMAPWSRCWTPKPC